MKLSTALSLTALVIATPVRAQILSDPTGQDCADKKAFSISLPEICKRVTDAQGNHPFANGPFLAPLPAYMQGGQAIECILPGNRRVQVTFGECYGSGGKTPSPK